MRGATTEDPYPRELERQVVLRNGTRVQLRPIRPEDAPRLVAAYERLSAHSACQSAIRVLEERTGGEGGLIAVDERGGVGWAYNTRAMPHAYAVDDGPVVSGA